MSKHPQKNDKLKVALIPVLGLVLLFVLLGGDSKSRSPAPELVNADTTTLGVVAASAASSAETGKTVTWPQYSLTEILQHNPLTLFDPRAMLEADFKAHGFYQEIPLTGISEEEFFLEEPTAEELSTVELNADQSPLSDKTSVTADERINEDGPLISQTVPDQAVALEDDADQVRQAEQVRQELEAATRLAADQAAEKQRAADEAVAEALNQRLNAIRNMPVSMYMKTARGNSALLGDRVISEGELLEDGIRVASISRRGITFEVIPQTSPADTPD